MKELAWNVFEKSGHIESYLLYKTLTNCQGEDGEEVKDEGNTCKGSDSTLL